MKRRRGDKEDEEEVKVQMPKVTPRAQGCVRRIKKSRVDCEDVQGGKKKL